MGVLMMALLSSVMCGYLNGTDAPVVSLSVVSPASPLDSLARTRRLTATSFSSEDCDGEIDSLYGDSPLPDSPDERREAASKLSEISGIDSPALREAESDWYAKLPADLWDRTKPACPSAFLRIIALRLELTMTQSEIDDFSGLFYCLDGVTLQAVGFVWANKEGDVDCVSRKKVLIGMLLHYKRHFYPGTPYMLFAYDKELIMKLLRLSTTSWLGRATAACHACMLAESKLNSSVYGILKFMPTGPLLFSESRDFFYKATRIQQHYFIKSPSSVYTTWSDFIADLDKFFDDENRPRVHAAFELLASRLQQLLKAAFFADMATAFSVVLDELTQSEYHDIFAREEIVTCIAKWRAALYKGWYGASVKA